METSVKFQNKANLTYLTDKRKIGFPIARQENFICVYRVYSDVTTNFKKSHQNK